MRLLDHVSISVRDLVAARPFYLAVMSALDVTVVYDRDDAIGFGERNRPAEDEHSYLTVRQSGGAVPDASRHWCLRASSAQSVRDFHAAGLQSGGTDAGAPGLRSYHEKYFAAFLFDPEGNKIEAVFHHGEG